MSCVLSSLITSSLFSADGKGYHVDDLKPLVNTKFFEDFEVKYNADESVSLEQVITLYIKSRLSLY